MHAQGETCLLHSNTRCHWFLQASAVIEAAHHTMLCQLQLASKCVLAAARSALRALTVQHVCCIMAAEHSHVHIIAPLVGGHQVQGGMVQVAPQVGPVLAVTAQR